MRVLLDENIPHDLVSALPGHEVATVQKLGWAGVKNGELLERATGRFDALVTMDGNLEYQQRLSQAAFGVVVIRAQSNRMVHLLPLVRLVLDALRDLQPGQVRRVGE